MKTNLVRHGDGHALVIDESILKQVQIDPAQPVDVSADGNRLIITALDRSETETIRDALEEVNRVHGQTLRRLAQ